MLGYMLLCTQKLNVCVIHDIQRLNVSDVLCVCRNNLGQWEKISRGEAEDIVPSRPCDSGPVKVDN